MVKVVIYESKYKCQWDQFIANSKNGIFLFYRDYLEYHADRFKDSSILFFDDDRLIAVMPANIKDDTLYSHEGVTFGGIISNQQMRSRLMLEIFDTLKEYLKTQGIKKIVYKAIPHIYHNIPAEEDLYALFRNDAKLIRRDISSTIFMKERKVLTKGRKWSIKKSKKNGLEIKRSYDFKTFMAIEEDLLRRKYRSKPTHSADEIRLLANRFPDNIKLFPAYKDNVMLAGVVMYESTNVVHAQYIAANDEGKKLGATDFIFSFLINNYYAEKEYFDFGISTENNGQYLNTGLVRYKESFGARAVVHDFYEMNV